MQVNRISNYNPNFTSKVYITNYSGKQEPFINSPEVAAELDKLENNGNNDSVIIDYAGNELGYRLYIKEGNNVLSKGILIDIPDKTEEPLETQRKSISEAYTLGKEKMKYPESWKIIPENMQKYVIS